jgi:anti-sigma B factor antagonist
MADQPRVRLEAERETAWIIAGTDMDLAGVPDFEAAAARAVATGCSQICVDMSNVTFLDSRGVAALVAAWRHARDAGCALLLTGTLAPPVRLVLEITAVDHLFGPV